jgi:hypothetical protein
MRHPGYAGGVSFCLISHNIAILWRRAPPNELFTQEQGTGRQGAKLYYPFHQRAITAPERLELLFLFASRAAAQEIPAIERENPYDNAVVRKGLHSSIDYPLLVSAELEWRAVLVRAFEHGV